MTASSSTLPYCSSNAFFNKFDDQVGVGIVGAEDQRLLPGVWIELPGEIVTNHLVERLRNDLTVKVLYLEIDLVRRGEKSTWLRRTS